MNRRDRFVSSLRVSFSKTYNQSLLFQMANLPWPELLPEKYKADELHRALMTLSDYYGQSSGKVAWTVRDRLNTLYPNRWTPADLTPWDEQGKTKESPKQAAGRQLYWTHTLRPFLIDDVFRTICTKTTVRVKEMRTTTEERDKALQTMRESVAYFDAYFEGEATPK